MKKINSIQDVIKNHLCISCGACSSFAPDNTITIELDNKLGFFKPKFIVNDYIANGIEFVVCPGKGLPLKSLSKESFPITKYQKFELGRFNQILVGKSANPKILKNASSGGLMTEIAWFLLKNDYIQGVTCTRFIYSDSGPKTECYIGKTFSDIINSQGSKYCPTDTNTLIKKCIKENKKYLFIGTPCQIGSLRMAMKILPKLKSIFPFTMSNFCGGFRNFHYLNSIIKKKGINPGDVNYFRFRGEGQPGSLLIITNKGEKISIPYPEYEMNISINKMKRCTFCTDATGELADFSCGDAWLKRFLNNNPPWSIIILRSNKACKIINEMIKKKNILTQSISSKEVIQSQFLNIESKKYRQTKRIKLNKLFGCAIPQWDEEFDFNYGNYYKEFRILIGKIKIDIINKFRLLRNY